MPVLELKNISFSYDNKKEPFMKNLSVSFRKGESVGIFGANGSGKSTLMKLATGILKPQKGEVFLFKREITSIKGKERAKQIGFLPQFFDAGLTFSVEEIVRTGFYPHDTPSEEALEHALQVTGLTKKREAPFFKLSGGEKRRVFLALTILQGADILLLDEAMANLDIKFQVEINTLLQVLKQKEKRTLIMSMHDINTTSLFDRIIFMKEGNIIATGKPEELLHTDLLREVYDVCFERIISEKGEPFFTQPTTGGA